MARQHPVHDAVAALTRVQRMRVNITPTVAYRVTAPCLLEQLAQELGQSCSTDTGGGGIAGSRLLLATDAWDLWVEIQHNTHTWARELDLDRRPYLDTPTEPARPLPQRRDTPTNVAPWWAALDPAAVDVIDPTRLPAPAPPASPPRREQVAAPRHEVPPVGRLLRLVAATAVGRGLDPIADAIARSTTRWASQITAMLHGHLQQRGIRGAICPACEATTVLEDRDDLGRVRVPAIVLVRREISGETLSWLACLACGWSRAPRDILTGQLTAYLVVVADVYRQVVALAPWRHIPGPADALERTAA